MAHGATVFYSAALFSVVSANLFDNLKFQNEGVVKSTDKFNRQWFSALYLECENCTKPQYSWAIKGANYLFRESQSAGSCFADSPTPGTDRGGGDYEAKPIDGDAGDCAQRCCEGSQCKAYVFAVAPSNYMDCVSGQKCCFLKSSEPSPISSSVKDIASGTVTRDCAVDSPQDSYDRPGGDLEAKAVTGGAQGCASRCCATTGCVAYVFAVAPSDFSYCKKGEDCCFLKNQHVTPRKSGVPGITTGAVSHADDGGPPIGMRSSVPLGGVGAGSFEIRADGSVKEVTIVNQSPAGSAKQGMFDGLLFAVRQGSSGIAKLLRTVVPAGIPAEAAASTLRYQGAYPVTRLELQDPALSQVNATLFALSRYRVNDLERSTLPGVALTLEATNTGEAEETVSFFVTLPLAVEEHYARRGSQAQLSSSAAASFGECLAACQSLGTCVSWTWDSASQTCVLMGDAPLGAFEDGVFSGIRGSWSVSKAGCLTLDRPAGGPAAGNASLCLPDGVGEMSFATGESSAALYATFAKTGKMSGAVSPGDAYGAAAVSMKVAAGSKADLSMALSWFFPARDYMDKTIGNFYATQFKDSAQAGQELLADLSTTVEDIVQFQRPLFESSLPEWLSDTLLNSVSHLRSAWLQGDGKWRQWEAYDCVNVDSIHNDGERHIPYIMFLPETTRNKMRAWGATQQADGMLPEQLACGCMGAVDPGLDRGCGRVMSDVSSMYVVYLLELYKWSNDTELVQELWPIARRAAQWHLDSATSAGVPERQCNTYDILGPQNFQQVSYNSAFHLLAMRAAEELARSPVIDDHAFADNCSAAFLRGQKALDENQWVDRGKGQGYYSFALEDHESLMVDTFYPQVLSYTLGLGPLVSEERLQAHLDTEIEWNDSPYGLVVHSAGSGSSLTNGVWQMGSPDWATLNIHLGFTSVIAALEQPKKSLGQWRSKLKDLWNVAGIADQSSGLPSITSHYGYFMTAWHLPLAISGQQADLPKGTLAFTPRVASPYALPLLLPGVIGLLRSPRDLAYEVELTVGALELASLEVMGCAYEGTPSLKVGQVLSWSCSSRTVSYV